MPYESSPVDFEDAVSAYLSGTSCEEAASRFQIAVEQLRDILKQRGVWGDEMARYAAHLAQKASATRRARFGIDERALADAYAGGASENALAQQFGVSRNAIAARLRATGVERRTMSEANRLRALNADPASEQRRRDGISAFMKGKTLSLESGIRRAATNEIRQSHVSATEQLLQCWLRERGIESIPQKAIGPYNTDLGAESVAVEIFGGNWHSHGTHALRTPERSRYILNAGWNLVFIWVNTQHAPLRPAAADYVAAFVEQSRRDPSLRGQYRVIWGHGEEVPTDSQDIDKIALVPPRSAGNGARA